MSIPTRLKSRKFWVTIGTAIILIANSQYEALVVLVMGYLGFQGIQDAVQVNAEAKAGNINASTEVLAEEESFDGTIVSGKEE